ncbi:MAG: hypothetical protein U1E56_08090 [Bauldia sp.]
MRAVLAMRDVGRRDIRGRDAGLSEADRLRFARWEEAGAEAVKHDVMTREGTLVEHDAYARSLAWEWVRLKESEAARVLEQVLPTAPGPAGFARDFRRLKARFAKGWALLARLRRQR